MEKQKILELDLGTDNVIKKSAELKAELDSVRERLAKMKKDGDTSSETYVKMESSMKKLSAEYNNNQKVLVALNNSYGQIMTTQDKLNSLMEENATTIDGARSNTAELIKIRNKLDLSTTQGIKNMELINEQIDKNDKFIKSNVSEREKQILNVGNYTQSIKDALNETGIFSGELQSLGKVTTAFSGTFGLVKDEIKASASAMKTSAEETEGMSVAQKGLTIATNIGTGAMRVFALALAATGIGLIIAAIALLIGYLRTFDPLMDKLEQGMSAVGAVVEVVQKTILDFVKGLTDLGGTINKIGNFLKNPIAGFKALGKEMKEAANAAIELKKAQQDLEYEVIKQEVNNAKASQRIKELMLQSRNLSLTEEERQAKLKEANKVEEENYKQRKSIADKELANAQNVLLTKAGITAEDIKRLKIEGVAYAIALKDRLNVTDEEVQAIKDAEVEKYKILEESTAYKEKIQNQYDALEEKRVAEVEKRNKKYEEERQKELDNAVATSRAKLDLYISEQGTRAKSFSEELAMAKKLRDAKLKIAQQEFDASKKTEADKLNLLVQTNNIKNEYLKTQNDIAVQNASRELELYIQGHESKLDADKYYSELALQEEQRRLDLIAKKEQDFQRLRFEKGLISEQEYQDAISQIVKDADDKKVEEKKRQADADKQRQSVDLANKMAIEDMLFQDGLEIQLERLNLQKQQELDNAEKTGADKELIQKKYAIAETKIRDQVEQNKLGTISDGLSQAKSLFKENTLAYKALAVAEATINTYKAASLALSSYAPPVGGIFAGIAIAQGLLQVSKIAGVKLAKGVIGLNGAGSGTSDSIPAMLSNGESVITAKKTSTYNELLKAIHEQNDVSYVDGVAYPTSVVNALRNSSAGSSSIDYDLLANKLAKANSKLPVPVLPLSDFHNANTNYVEVIQGANH